MSKSEPQPLGRNDASPEDKDAKTAYRLTPKLGLSELFPGLTVVTPEESGKFGTRTGRNE